MDKQVVALVIAQIGQVITNYFQTRPVQPRSSEIPSQKRERIEAHVESQEHGQKATSIESGCVPCSIGHLGTCSGLINESVRFAREGGMESNEVLDRVDMCLTELNALERTDLRPEMIVDLPKWEKEIANRALVASRSLRHTLEKMETVDDLEQAAALSQQERREVFRAYMKHKLGELSPEQRKLVQQKAIEITQVKEEELEEEIG